MAQARQTLEMRQRQNLVMTTQLRQSIELLQLPSQELAAYVAQELEENPFLQEASEHDSPTEEYPAIDSATEPAETTEPQSATDDEAAYGWTGTEGSSESSGFAGDSDAHQGWIQSLADQPPDLRAHVLQQIHIDAASGTLQLLASHLIDQLDANGYLPEDCVERSAERLGAETDAVMAALALLQRCDPPGVGARSLQECLRLQLQELGALSPAMQGIIANLPLVAKADYAALAKLCGVSAAEIPELCRLLQRLNPKPGSCFDAEPAREAVPDVLVRQRGGNWQVELNPGTLPRLLVNHDYYAVVNTRQTSKEEKQFFTDRLQHANWLMRALEQRANTLLRVATELVARQRGFLEAGISRMRPLTLREVADAIGMHESTVSRVTSGKFMATPRGTFELKYFFHTAIGSSYGEDTHSSAQVKHRIKTLIDNEKPDAILTDDNLATLLRAEGINAARRTVAKYRESLHIPGSVIRKRLKRLG